MAGPVQRGALAYSEPPTDLDAVRRYRLQRIRAELEQRDFAAVLLYDPVNTRYATDATNMQVWSMHNEQRYVLVLSGGPVIVFEGESARHLSEGLPTVDEVRLGVPWFYFCSGARCEALVQGWADEIDDLVRTHGGGNRQLAVDRVGAPGVLALESRGLQLHDAFELMEHARVIKSEGELALMRFSVRACEQGMARMHAALRPGITENALWSILHQQNIEQGGEWIETRLLSSGPRTCPWFQECSDRVIQEGELVAFDTDLIGPYGYCADISRTWVCGDEAGAVQRELHSLAVDQLDHNLSLVRAGVSFREISERAWPIPVAHRAHRYSCIGHGVGLADEYPSLYEREDYAQFGYDGVLEENMALCLESYVADVDGSQGVKLEQQVRVTAGGFELLSHYPLALERS